MWWDVMRYILDDIREIIYMYIWCTNFERDEFLELEKIKMWVE